MSDGLGAIRYDAPKPDAVPVDIPITEESNILTASDGTQMVQLPDGSVQIGIEEDDGETEYDFGENLAEKLSDTSLESIAFDIADGVSADELSRMEMVEAYNAGMDLLGLKIKNNTGGQTKKNISTVNHPVLLESIVKFQSGARAEMLPADGPCKTKIDVDETEQLTELAEQLEQDLNHYLTTTATEYYPDMDRGLFRLGYGGTLFKKAYRCPIRKRPVSECVFFPDLIVSEEATDLENAVRVTHQITMAPSVVKRMQLSGYWKEVELTTPMVSNDSTKKKINSIEGKRNIAIRSKDQTRTIWECYTDLDLKDYGHTEAEAPEGLPLPYRVTLDKDSKKILEIRRMWKEGDSEFRKKLPFVMYMLIPGMGFSGYGYLHLLGNQTKALTAVWRILLDAGMFSNFPGGVRVKGTRQTTNEINPGPGEWPEIDTGPMDDIRKALMPLPYKEPSAVLIQLSEIIGQDAQRMAGAVEMEVGEGRANVPVGTIMAMIEQQTQVMAAVHKRLHTSQQKELMLLRELFADDPESLWKYNPNPKRQWTAEEFTNLSIVPASDPNVPAQMHRIMQATALITLAAQNPDLYNKREVHKRALKTMGIGDIDSFLNEDQPQQPNPEMLGKIAEIKNKQQETAIKAQATQQKSMDTMVKAKISQQEIMLQAQKDQADNQSRHIEAQSNVQEEQLRLAQKIIANKGKDHEKE